MAQNIEQTIYKGVRGEPFKSLIAGLLHRAKLTSKYISILTDDESMSAYSQAFTAASADPRDNYEIFEQLGDVSANKFIVWYAYRRFPQLFCPLGVKVVARLRINYGAKQSFYEIADRLGFWPFISASDEERDHAKKDLLEDTLESFCGATEYILDNRTRPGVGYAIVYDILESIFDEMPISLKYEDLYDSKTRLKELFDKFPNLGKWEFREVKDDTITTSTLWQIPPHGRKEVIGKGQASKKGDAQQRAAESGLLNLNRKGWVKEVSNEYSFFCRD